MTLIPYTYVFGGLGIVHGWGDERGARIFYSSC